ncbi:glucosaminidase domain-containing protein [Candidatus Daviesbacteria bacterium]|nr:glucosaminidase domain-containing protein [Candidatus Daviesbacteria bacterium]
MKIKLFISFLLILPFLFSNTSVLAQKAEVIKTGNTVSHQIETRQLDKRAKILAKYLAKYNSPLQYHAQDFIDAADQYGLDWKMLPSIAGVESTFGKHIPGGYNAWGWGVYGTQAIYFDSWKDGIFTIAKGLREGYLNKGLTEPYSINRVYAASPHWAKGVTYFMSDMEKFSNTYENTQRTQVGQTPSIAAVSGQLALR